MLLSSFLPLSRWRRLVCALWWLARRLAVALGFARAPPSLCAALSGCRRWCALACAAVVLFCLASRFRSAPQDEAKTRNNYAVRGLAAARPLSAALAASVGVSAFGLGLTPCPPAGSPALRPSVAFLGSAPCIHYTTNVCSIHVYLIQFVLFGG